MEITFLNCKYDRNNAKIENVIDCLYLPYKNYRGRIIEVYLFNNFNNSTIFLSNYHCVRYN